MSCSDVLSARLGRRSDVKRATSIPGHMLTL
jgi:hypothetical protein